MTAIGQGLANPWIQFIDPFGNPYELGTVTWTAPGVSTHQDTFADAGLTVANANPQNLDAAGRCLTYFSPLPYDYTVKTAAGVSFGPIRFSGGTAPTIANLLGGWFNVKDYGALGNGIADDTAACLAAIAACAAAGGGIVYVPPGVYLISSTLLINHSDIQLVGAGGATRQTQITLRSAATTLKWVGGTGAGSTMVLLSSTAGASNLGVVRVGVSNMVLDGNYKSANVLGLLSVRFWTASDLTITGPGDGSGCFYSGVVATLGDVRDTQQGIMRNCCLNACNTLLAEANTLAYGLYLTGDATANTSENVFENLEIVHSKSPGIYLLTSADSNSFTDIVVRCTDIGTAVTSITRSGTTATLTSTTVHGFEAGDLVDVVGANESAYNGLQLVLTAPTTTTLTYTVAGSPTTPATGTITIPSAVKGVLLEGSSTTNQVVNNTFTRLAAVANNSGGGYKQRGGGANDINHLVDYDMANGVYYPIVKTGRLEWNSIGQTAVAASVVRHLIGNIVVGDALLAQGATDGLLWIPTITGTPNGTPTTYAGAVPMAFDPATTKLWVYNTTGAVWKSVTLA